jgi:O-antigen/teichoic acid export membrane protein
MSKVRMRAVQGYIKGAWESLRAARTSLIGASFIIVQPLLLNALSLPVTGYIIATLGPHDYGQWAVALTLMMTGSLLTNLGLRSFFVRRVAQHPEVAPHAFAEQLGLRVSLAILGGTLSVIVAYSLGYSEAVVACTAILAAGAIFTAVGAVVSDLLSATERLPMLASINMAAGLALTAASALAMYFGGGLLTLSMAYLVGPVLTGLMSLTVVHRRIFPVRVRGGAYRYWHLVKEARVLGLQLFVMNLGNHTENLLVPKLVGLTSYGYFAAGTLLPRRLEVVPDGLNTAFFPVLARAYKHSHQQAVSAVTRLGAFMLAASVPAAVLMWVLADPIAQLLFPENPAVCRTVIRITVWWVPLLGIGYGMGYALNAAGRERDEARLAIIGTIVSLTLSVALIVQLGLIGACFALVAKAAIGCLVRLPAFIDSLRAARTSAVAPAAAEQRV